MIMLYLFCEKLSVCLFHSDGMHLCLVHQSVHVLQNLKKKMYIYFCIFYTKHVFINVYCHILD